MTVVAIADIRPGLRVFHWMLARSGVVRSYDEGTDKLTVKSDDREWVDVWPRLDVIPVPLGHEPPAKAKGAIYPEEGVRLSHVSIRDVLIMSDKHGAVHHNTRMGDEMFQIVTFSLRPFFDFLAEFEDEVAKQVRAADSEEQKQCGINHEPPRLE